ncbi:MULTISPECIES: hypothetical protein [Aerosakkonema]|uniref:hypothetical protein n=1 Tax=Aerosakkonema TaxID=1246629 RepID=UPI0035B83409
MTEIYGDIKKNRRSSAEIQQVKEAILRVLSVENPMTVRQVFYQLVSTGAIAKTEAEYKSTVVRLLTEMRRTGEIPYYWIADNTRFQRKPKTWSSLKTALLDTARYYRRSLWEEAKVYVEIWLEKDALAGVLYQVTEAWDVPLMVTRGYPSLSFLHSAAETIKYQNKPTYIYYFGDRDPSGVDIPRVVNEGISSMAPHIEIFFEAVAVTPAQIEYLHLPTRPTKTSDSRSKKFSGESVEVDAIPPSILRHLVNECILKHVDFELLQKIKAIETEERTLLEQLSIWYQSQQQSMS